MHPGIDVFSSFDCVNRTTVMQMRKAFTRSTVLPGAIRASWYRMPDGDPPTADRGMGADKSVSLLAEGSDRTNVPCLISRAGSFFIL
jgi:hypothetical protein